VIVRGLETAPFGCIVRKSTEARASTFLKTMKNFLFINCSSNKRIIVQAADHDQALRAAAKEAGHFFLSFITIL
jgi:hypothetical protein